MENSGTETIETCLRELERQNLPVDERINFLTILKREVLLHGIPIDKKSIFRSKGVSRANQKKLKKFSIEGDECKSTLPNLICLRGRIWKALLGVGRMDADRYMKLVNKGEHPEYGRKILNDTFRTFQNNKRFAERVPEKKLIRILNAFVHAHSSNDSNSRQFSYVQGMNALCGPLLYVLPELDAFYCFEILVTKLVPSYVRKNLDGVVEGCKLVEKCLETFDPDLLDHFRSNLNASSRVYAFAPILTLSSCSPPLDNVLDLWDIYFAGGVHLNILFVTSQLILMRDSLLSVSKSEIPPCLTGRRSPTLNPQSLAALCFPLILKLPRSLYDDLVNHTQISIG